MISPGTTATTLQQSSMRERSLINASSPEKRKSLRGDLMQSRGWLLNRHRRELT
jgi:hypothetical protein